MSIEMDYQQESPLEFINRLGIKFNDYSLLSRSLTHRSFLNEHPEALEDNERLEFLGDAVLDFLVGEWLYNRFPEMEEGQLTQMRSALVQTNQLAEFARMLKLENVIRLGKGELKSGGKLRNSLLCDAFEAFIGAVFLDQGINYVREILSPIIESSIGEVIALHKNEDPKSKLQEWAQSHGYQTPKYITKSIQGPDHARTFEIEVSVKNIIMGFGIGKSKQNAEKIAAKMALARILDD